MLLIEYCYKLGVTQFWGVYTGNQEVYIKGTNMYIVYIQGTRWYLFNSIQFVQFIWNQGIYREPTCPLLYIQGTSGYIQGTNLSVK